MNRERVVEVYLSCGYQLSIFRTGFWGLNVVKFFGDNDVERSELESLRFCLLRCVRVFEEKGRSNKENHGGITGNWKEWEK